MEIINIEDDVDEGRVKENLMIQRYGDGVSWSRGRLLGEGGFGSVFLATMKCPSSRFKSLAVKSAEISSSDSLQYERKVLSSLVGCSNIIQCIGEEITCGIDGSKVYNLLLEYGSGGNLAERVFESRGCGLPEYEVRWYTRSILKGLIKIHQVGYVHCDLKPENILLVPRNRKDGRPEFMAKICDLGLAKRVKEDRQKRKLQRTWRGTPMFLPPEAVREGLQETPGDIWSLGCIVLEMLTGHQAWDVEEEGLPNTQEKIMRKLLKGVAVPKIPKELSQEAKSFLRCCLRRMVKNRAAAKTLLYHPFVSGLRDDDDDLDNGIRNGVEERQAERVEDMKAGLSSGSDDVPWSQCRRNCLCSSQIRPHLHFV